MTNLWDKTDASKCETDLAMRAYTSRLIGKDTALVLHGGGNTSVKSTQTDIYGQDQNVIHVKASGFDLALMGEEGFTTLKLAPLLKLATLPTLSDTDMVREVRKCQLDPSAANASIEAIVHAIMPPKYIDHSHADAILTISNSSLSREIWRELYGENVAILPYVKPGFDLAKQIQTFTDEGGFENCNGIILEQHGLFTFAEDPEESYNRHIEIVGIAQSYLDKTYGTVQPEPSEIMSAEYLARTRKAVGQLAGSPVISRPSCQVPKAKVNRLHDFTHHGTVTPEHVIHNKPFPALISSDEKGSLNKFAQDYKAYFQRANDPNLTMLPSHPHWAMFESGAIRSFAPNLKRAQISADVAQTTVKALTFAEKIGGWQGLSEEDLRALEYWELEQAKLKKQPKGPKLTGKVALVTGAASGIGLAIAQKFHAQGAVIAGLDINSAINDWPCEKGMMGLQADLTNPDSVESAIKAIVHEYGGIDIIVSNAGIFESGHYVETMEASTWRRSMSINLDAHMNLIRAAIPVLRHGFDPSIVIMASRNVTAPGAGASAYSVAKAGLTQLMRILALELAPDGVTVNAMHPDAIFDTDIWTDDVLEKSAKRYGMTVDEYKTRNLLKKEINSQHVASAALALVDGSFARTTGAQIPVDGGNERVI